MIKIMKHKNGDKSLKIKKGQMVVVETNYGWDPEKVILVGKLIKIKDRSEYKSSLENCEETE